VDQAIERRRFPRFKVKRGLTAVLRPGRGRTGEISNISKSGIAFSYITSGNWTNEPSAIDIFAQDGGSRIEKIPCKSVYESPDRSKVSSGFMEWRTHGIKFGEMTQRQKEKLNGFIRDYTTSWACGNLGR